MSSGSGSRNPPSANHHGGEDEFSKRRKSFYPSSTRRDFSSNSLSSSNSHAPAAASPSSYSKPSLRTEKLSSDYVSRSPRYRDSSAAPNPNNHANTKLNTFKESRYPPYGKPYSYSPSYNQERPSGAYGSFSSAKRAETDSYNNYNLRDLTSRDVVNGSSQRDSPAYPRNPWRSDRPKLSTSASPASKTFSSSRFNPNNIPVISRSGGSNSLSSSVSHNSKRERYESYDDKSSNRWKPYGTKKYDRPGSFGSFGRVNNKERIRSSGLTNSVGSTKRSDSYLPGKTPQQSRFSDRYSRESNEDEESEPLQKDVDRPKSAIYDESFSSNFGERTGISETSQQMDTSRDMNEGEDEGEGEDEDEDEDEENDEDDAEEDDDEDDEDHEKEGEESQDRDNSIEGAEKKVNEPAPQIPKSTSSTTIKTNDTDRDTSSLSSLPNEPSFQELGAITYPEGCMFPRSEIDSKLEQLKSELASHGPLNYPASIPLSDPKEFICLPSTSLNLQKFTANYSAYTSLVKARNLDLKKKKIQLWKTYDSYSKENQTRGANMKEQLDFLHNADDETRKELDSIDIRMKASEMVPESPAFEAPAPSGRRGRRHGDSVTTEAEFQEILRTLKNEDNEDPLIKAKQVSAEIPDLILDPLEREAFKFMDSNNLVQDKATWESRLKTDFATNFTEIEHELYCEAFCRAPKRFGEIARIMGGLRSLHECVLHYYITKKNVNYKFMVSQYKKKASKRNFRRKKKAKDAQVDESSEITETVLENGDIDAEKSLAEEFLTADVKRTFDDDDSAVEPAPKKGRIDVLDHDKSAATEATVVQKPDGEPSTKSHTETGQSHVEGPSLTDNESIAPSERQLSELPIKSEDPKGEKASDEGKKPNGTVFKPPIESSAKPSKEAAPESSIIKEEPARAAEHENAHSIVENSECDVGEKRKQISSYWSITDVNAFPEYLAQYGSKWTLIADKLATKSATMVRNYYQRNADKFAWAAVMAEADRKLAQGGSAYENPLSVESTIVVKPQKIEDQQPALPNMEAYKPEAASASTQPQTPKENSAAVTHLRPLQMAEVGIQPREESHKPSILSLLNAESNPETTKSTSAPPPRNNDLAALLNASSSPVVPPKEETSKPRAKANSISSLLG